MKTVLILRFSAMGDVAIAASVMREVATQHPDLHFVFATRPFFSPFFDDIANLEVFPVDFEKGDQGIFGIWRLYKDIIKKYKIDFVADLHDVLRSKLLTLFFRLSLIKIKIATIYKGRKEKRSLCRINNPNKKLLKSTWQRYVDVFYKLGFVTNIKPKPIIFNPLVVKKIGISPFAQHQGKMYPLELMEKVLEFLHNYYIFLFGGGKKEQEICEKWQEKYENVHSVVGKYSLKQELEFISSLDVMLSMDSANMHLASLCGVPCISIWGATHPYAGFVGFGQEEKPKIQLDLPCRPCSVYGKKKCKYKDYRCLCEITPEKIVNSFHSPCK